MQFGKVRRPTGEVAVVVVEGGRVFALNTPSLADVLHAPDPLRAGRELTDVTVAPQPLAGQDFLAPIDRQEVWAAGVTYKRSKVAREEESRGAAQFYDKVYTADRPELFLKATPERVV